MNKERDDSRRLEVNDLVNKLEIRKCINMDIRDLNDESLEIAIDSQESIWKLVKEQPDLLPFIVNELVYKGSYFESMAFAPVADTEIYKKGIFYRMKLTIYGQVR